MSNDTQKTWTLRLTPADAPATTVTGVSHDDMRRFLFESIHGSGAAEAIARRRRDGEHEQPLAA